MAGAEPYVLTEKSHGGTHARKILDNQPAPIAIDLCSRMNSSGISVNEAWNRLQLVGVHLELDQVRKLFVSLNTRFAGEYDP